MKCVPSVTSLLATGSVGDCSLSDDNGWHFCNKCNDEVPNNHHCIDCCKCLACCGCEELNPRDLVSKVFWGDA